MPNLREIRRRIRSVRNTSQITRAMEMIAATKLRRVQSLTVSARPYADRLRRMVASLSALTAGAELHPLLQRRPVRRLGVVLMTTERGLCGALNTNLIEHASRLIADHALPTDIIAVGRKGRDFMLRRRLSLVADFTAPTDRPAYLDAVPIARVAVDAFLGGQVDEVVVVHPDFVSTLVQRPASLRLLPLPELPQEEIDAYRDYIFEPDPQTVLAALLPRYVETQVYQAILETAASEHAARMVAMRNATQNAKELVQELTLTFNKTRQDVITKELLEIASGAETLRAAAG
ncbi:MAG: ATP synthase F1 subunit gamma [Chloroflexi bacterium]|nr:ATP synthase F1 subunit gamma [Chloroflexota bacterium]